MPLVGDVSTYQHIENYLTVQFHRYVFVTSALSWSCQMPIQRHKRKFIHPSKYIKDLNSRLVLQHLSGLNSKLERRYKTSMS